MIAAGDPQDRYSQYPSAGLTPWKLTQILQEAAEGNVRRQMELFEDMEEKDPHMFSQFQTRKLAVTGLEWEVQPFSDEETDQAVADFVREQILSIENFDDVMTHMLDAIEKGISIMEIIWGVDAAGHNVIDDILYIHQKKLMWAGDSEDLLLVTMDHPEGMPLIENKFVVHHYTAKSGHPSRAGLMRVCSWMYLFKNFNIKDWVAFAELYGQPLRLGKYDQAASEKDKTELLRALIQLGSDAAGIIPDSTTIEFIEANKTSSSEVYENLARYADEQISKAILGQTLTSDSGGGSYAQSKTHDEVRHDLTVADAKALAVTIRRDIIRPLVEFNFPGAEIPLFDFDIGDDETKEQKADLLEKLVGLGLKVPAAYAYKTFAIPQPEEGEEILAPSIRQAFPAAGLADTELKAMSDDPPGERPEQAELDKIVALCNSSMAEIMGRMVGVLRQEAEGWDGSLAEFAEALKDKDRLSELYAKMESPELDDLLHQSIYLSSLIGRTQE